MCLLELLRRSYKMTTNVEPTTKQNVQIMNTDSKLNTSFVDLFRQEELTDATLICQNKRIRVHKFLLSASSEFFNDLFRKYPNDCSLLIENVNYDDFLKVLEYIYSGRTELNPKKVLSFIETAKKFSIQLRFDQMHNVPDMYKPFIQKFVSITNNNYSGKK